MKRGTVSAIIVNWNGKHLLSACLDTLRAQTRPADEIIVVDNGSSDGSQTMLRERYADVLLIELPDNKGFSIANNIGIRHAQGDYIALLNNDLILDPMWIAHMADALDGDDALGSCACKMLSYHQRGTIDAAGMVALTNGVGVNRGMREADSSRFAQRDLIFGPCAGAAMYRAEMLRDIGSFDEDIYLYYEDVDLSYRAQLAGYDCLYVPEAVAYHHSSATSSRSGIREYYLARNSLPVIVKNMPAPLLRRFFWRIVTGQLPYAFHAGAAGDTRRYVRSQIDSLRLLPRMLCKRRQIQQSARRSAEDIAARLT